MGTFFISLFCKSSWRPSHKTTYSWRVSVVAVSDTCGNQTPGPPPVLYLRHFMQWVWLVEEKCPYSSACSFFVTTLLKEPYCEPQPHMRHCCPVATHSTVTKGVKWDSQKQSKWDMDHSRGHIKLKTKPSIWLVHLLINKLFIKIIKKLFQTTCQGLKTNSNVNRLLFMSILKSWPR